MVGLFSTLARSARDSTPGVEGPGYTLLAHEVSVAGLVGEAVARTRSLGMSPDEEQQREAERQQREVEKALREEALRKIAEMKRKQRERRKRREQG